MNKFMAVQLMLVFAFALSANAQTLLSPQQAVQTGIENNLGLELYKNNLKIAELSNSKAAAGYYPNVVISVQDNLSNNNLQQKFTNGTEVNSNFVWGNNLTAGLNSDWTIFNGFRIQATKSRLAQEQQMSKLELEQAILDMSSRILLAYYDIVRLKIQVQTIDQNIVVLTERTRLSKDRFEVGTVNKSEFLQGSIDLQQAKTERENQLTGLRNAKMELNRLQNRPVETEFEVLDNFPLQAIAFDDTYLQNIERRNLALQIARSNEQLNVIDQRIAKSYKYPTALALGSYNYNLTQNQAGFSIYNQSNGLNLGLGVSMPIYLGGSIRRNQEIAKIESMTTQSQTQDLLQTINLAFNQARWQYDQAIKILASEEQNIPLAQENLQIASDRFRIGQAQNTLELREAEETFFLAKTRVTLAGYSAKVAEINLILLQGNILEGTIGQ
ncbi:MAG: TolC family protein [Saprospiraceae bacterium]